MFAAEVTHVWHFWLAVPLALGIISLILFIIMGYFRKVVSPRCRADD